MSSEQQQPDSAIQPEHPEPHEFRKVPAQNGIRWLNRAFYLFKLNPGVWISCVLVMTVILVILLVIPLVQMLAVVLTPVFTAGLMLGSENLRDQKEFQLSHLFSGFQEKTNPLLLVGLIYLASTFICSLVAIEISASIGFPMMQITPEMATNGQLNIEAFIESLIIPTLLMMALMVPVLMAYWFAPALVILKGSTPVSAMKTSFSACMVNMKPFLIYGIVAFIATVLSMALVNVIAQLIPILAFPLIFIFNLIIMSIFFASMFTSYDDIFSFNENHHSANDDKPDTLTV